MWLLPVCLTPACCYLLSHAALRSLGASVAVSAVALYSSVVEVFLPTPRNCHYLFNMRDIAKVVQGIMQSDKKVRVLACCLFASCLSCVCDLWVIDLFA